MAAQQTLRYAVVRINTGVRSEQQQAGDGRQLALWNAIDVADWKLTQVS